MVTLKDNQGTHHAMSDVSELRSVNRRVRP
jgi:hypothetical protein